MSDRDTLFSILEFILNKADDRDIQAIVAALERRKSSRILTAASGESFNPSAVASQVGAEVQKQLGYTMDGLRESVRDMVVKMIREKAPEISEAELNTLLEEWVPDPSQQSERQRLPSEALAPMLNDFMDFSEGRMSVFRQAELRELDPDWKERYWAGFPGELRRLVEAYFKGRIEGETFWKAAYSVLGI